MLWFTCQLWGEQNKNKQTKNKNNKQKTKKHEYFEAHVYTSTWPKNQWRNQREEKKNIYIYVYIFIQTKDKMWLHKTYETEKISKSKDYNKWMSQIINLTLQLKQLEKEKKHANPKVSFGEKKIIDSRTEKKSMKTMARINNTKRGL